MAWFRIPFAENAFRRFLKERGLTLETLSVEEGIAAMTAFHVEHRAQHTVGGEDTLQVTRSRDTATVVRRMTRSDQTLSRTLTLTIDAAGARMSFS